MKTSSFWRRLLITLPIVSMVLLPLGCTETVTVGGDHMEPTIFSGQSVKIDRFAYRRDDPERADILLIRVREDEGILLRVIGLPSETVRIEGGLVYVNGTLLDEPYLVRDTYTESNTKEFSIPEDFYFVLGDNRAGAMDSDSRTGQFISRGAIVAKVIP